MARKIPDKAKTRAAIEKMATDSPEERAAIIKKMMAADSPEKRAAIEKMMADSPEKRAAREARKTIRRANAIHDGLIPPPWAEKLLNPAGRARLDHIDKGSDEPPRAIDRVKAVLPDIYPPDGKPPRELSLKAITREVGKACEEKRPAWKRPSEDTVQRALEELGHRPQRKRRKRP